jgi:hypothetical protein
MTLPHRACPQRTTVAGGWYIHFPSPPTLFRPCCGVASTAAVSDRSGLQTQPTKTLQLQGFSSGRQSRPSMSAGGRPPGFGGTGLVFCPQTFSEKSKFLSAYPTVSAPVYGRRCRSVAVHCDWQAITGATVRAWDKWHVVGAVRSQQVRLTCYWNSVVTAHGRVYVRLAPLPNCEIGCGLAWGSRSTPGVPRSSPPSVSVEAVWVCQQWL